MRYIGLRGPVLEVGPGHRPYPHSDVLVDKFLEDTQREGSLHRDQRPLIVCGLESLPFRDQVFAYSIAAHVVEHVTDPAQALAELQRVSHAGYIETPSALMEFLEPHRTYHRWSVLEEDGALVFLPKDPESTGFRQRMNNRLIQENAAFRFFAHSNPRLFKTRLEWTRTIPFRIEARAFHPDEYLAAVRQTPLQFAGGVFAKLGGLLLRRTLPLWRSRRKPDLAALLCCPRCRGALRVQSDRVACAACHGSYPRRGRMLFLTRDRFTAGGG